MLCPRLLKMTLLGLGEGCNASVAACGRRTRVLGVYFVTRSRDNFSNSETSAKLGNPPMQMESTARQKDRVKIWRP